MSSASFYDDMASAPQPEGLRAIMNAVWRQPERDCVASLLTRFSRREPYDPLIRVTALQLIAELRRSAKPNLVQALIQEFSLSTREGIALMCLAEGLLRIPDAASRDALIRDKMANPDWTSHLGQASSLFMNASVWGLVITGKLSQASRARYLDENAQASEELQISLSGVRCRNRHDPESEGGQDSQEVHKSDRSASLAGSLARLLARTSEPMIRMAMDAAMRLMGDQFVSGKSIEEALQRAIPLEQKGFRHSYDMLGEAAMTGADADRYHCAYASAIKAMAARVAGPVHGAGEENQNSQKSGMTQQQNETADTLVRELHGISGLFRRPGISIKLSALHPRYVTAQRTRVMAELAPRVAGLARLAREHDIGINIDAEESERLDLSLDILEQLCLDPELAGWNGIGFVVQAYQKRSIALIDVLIDLARRSHHRLMVRLVKGAYWDSEIKRAQVDGMSDYPVFTRKEHTDVSYLACANAMLNAADAIYPQFATHNAQTVAAIYHMAGPDYYTGQYEFQCLHGMGETLYQHVIASREEGGLGRPCRIYAPVGTHETLLAYLVRRLLENGANSSFVHLISDPDMPADTLAENPVDRVRQQADCGAPHPRIALPSQLFATASGVDSQAGQAVPEGAPGGRLNSSGIDLNDRAVLAALAVSLQRYRDDIPASRRIARPTCSAAQLQGDSVLVLPLAVHNPACRTDIVGHVIVADEHDVSAAVIRAHAALPVWREQGRAARAALLVAAAEALQTSEHQALFIDLMVREAGKTLPNAASELREAIDFLRYYAEVILRSDWPDTAPPLGVIACISPWNFPLAIFIGQISAALAAGNTVVAKPAGQTPLIAAAAVDLLHACGVPADVLQLAPGDADTGAALVRQPHVAGVMFTGSTGVARLIAASVARRLTPEGESVILIAETGGQNAMLIDSSALPEQAVADVLLSAFDSAGQRCSALRLLYVQEDIAEPLMTMLHGALAELVVDRPDRLATDIGPVIDFAAQEKIQQHVSRMRAEGMRVSQPSLPPCCHGGSFVAPSVIELDHPRRLADEVFGPVLHVVRYRREQLSEVLAQIRDSGYGLTFGIQSRIDDTINYAVRHARAGNVYVNRNMVGAVVGVQPFGGEGLSGTGPKAGGPLYVRHLTRCTAAHLVALPTALLPEAVLQPGSVAEDLWNWLLRNNQVSCAERLRFSMTQTAVLASPRTLPGPTGERNSYCMVPRGLVLCLSAQRDALLLQIVAALVTGNHVLLPVSASVAEDAGGSMANELYHSLPPLVQASIICIASGPRVVTGSKYDALLYASDSPPAEYAAQVLALLQDVRGRSSGPVIPVQLHRTSQLVQGQADIGLAMLMTERVVTVNTTASGGNAALMTSV